MQSIFLILTKIKNVVGQLLYFEYDASCFDPKPHHKPSHTDMPMNDQVDTCRYRVKPWVNSQYVPLLWQSNLNQTSFNWDFHTLIGYIK